MTQNVVFLFVLVASLGFFAYNAQRLVTYLRTANDEHRTDHPWTRLRNVLVIGIGQAKILRDPFAGAAFQATLQRPNGQQSTVPLRPRDGVFTLDLAAGATLTLTRKEHAG